MCLLAISPPCKKSINFLDEREKNSVLIFLVVVIHLFDAFP